jgi:hypothetical protein
MRISRLLSTRTASVVSTGHSQIDQNSNRNKYSNDCQVVEYHEGSPVINCQ